MNMSGSEGIFRVHIDVYLYSCSKLEHLHESNELSLLCRGPEWQQMHFSDSIQSHYCISRSVPSQIAAICEILNAQMTDRLDD
jgi:hypothetical protein